MASAIPTTRSSSSARARRLPTPYPEPDERCLGDLLADSHDRVERGHRLLEDHRDREPTQLSAAVRVELQEVDTLELDRATHDPCAPRQEPDEGAQRDRLAGARLPDEAERLAASDLERRAVDRPEGAAGERELDLQVPHAEQRLAHSGLSRSASPSASSESPSAVITTAIPGIVDSSQRVVRNVWPSPIIRPQSGVGGWTPRPR